MVGPFLEAFMGDLYRSILYFYQDNSLILSSIILAYGLFMFAAWNNLLRIYRFLIVEMAKDAHTSEELNRKKSNKKIRKIIGVPWEKAVEASPFPFIARIGALVPKRKTVENLQLLFDEKELADNVLKALQGARIKRMIPSTRKMLQRETDQREEKQAAKDNKQKE
ncbi:MAG: hypothetical protein DRI65_12305 [Chloroflexota bacterium]|nr:MAG: hypothetical protein DRI65_12305 [Chloroflexota bacterium]